MSVISVNGLRMSSVMRLMMVTRFWS